MLIKLHWPNGSLMYRVNRNRGGTAWRIVHSACCAA